MKPSLSLSMHHILMGGQFHQFFYIPSKHHHREPNNNEVSKQSVGRRVHLPLVVPHLPTPTDARYDDDTFDTSSDDDDDDDDDDDEDDNSESLVDDDNTNNCGQPQEH